jgi:hypothetical protein
MKDLFNTFSSGYNSATITANEYLTNASNYVSNKLTNVKIVAEKIKDFAIDLFNTLVSGCSSAKNILVKSITNSKNFIVEKLTNAKNFIGDKLTNVQRVVKKIKNFAIDFYNTLVNGCSSAKNRAKKSITNTKNFIANKLTDAKNFIGDKLTNVQRVAKKIKNFAIDFYNTLVNGCSSAKNRAKKSITNTKKFIVEKLTDAKNFIGDKLTNVQRVVKKIKNFVIDFYNTLANGCSSAKNRAKKSIIDSKNYIHSKLTDKDVQKVAKKVKDFALKNKALLIFFSSVLFSYSITSTATFAYLSKLKISLHVIVLENFVIGAALLIIGNILNITTEISKETDDRINYLATIINLCSIYLSPIDAITTASTMLGLILSKTIYRNAFKFPPKQPQILTFVDEDMLEKNG